MKDIEKGAEEAGTKIRKLGDKRGTVKEQQMFLSRISSDFQKLTKAAVEGNYVDQFFGGLRSPEASIKRLCAFMQNANPDFEERMRKHGQSRRIVDQNKPGSKERSNDLTAISRDNYEAEIVTLLKKNRGRELPGMYNPMIIGELFHAQAQPWEKIAREHIGKILKAVGMFLEQVFAWLTDETTASNLLRNVVGPALNERAKAANEKLDEILVPYTRGHPITYNHYFTETIQKIREERHKRDIAERLRGFSGLFDTTNRNTDSVSGHIGAGFRIDDLVNALSYSNEADMNKYAASEILICMEAYYKASESATFPLAW